MKKTFWRLWLKKRQESGMKDDRDIQLNVSLNTHTLSPEEISGLWKRIQQGNEQHHVQDNKQPMAATNRWYGVAAAMGLIAVSALFFLTGSVQQEYRTGYGETKTIVLPDRSTVILNANTRISFDKNWEKSDIREIWLDGEAYFSVVHKDNNQRFKVSTPGGVGIEVLGTTFTVSHRPVGTKVVLNSGQISLSFPIAKKERRILMKPGQMVEYKANKFSTRVVDPSIYAAWTEKKIILNETSLQEMISIAKDNFGIDVEVQSEKMLEQTVSGSMPLGDAENFVNQVARAFQLKAVQHSNKYLLIE